MYLGNVGQLVTQKKGIFQFNQVTPGEYDIYTVLDDESIHIFRRVKVVAGKGSIYKLRMPGSSGLSLLWIILISAGGLIVIGAGTVLTIILFKKKRM